MSGDYIKIPTITNVNTKQSPVAAFNNVVDAVAEAKCCQLGISSQLLPLLKKQIVQQYKQKNPIINVNRFVDYPNIQIVERENEAEIRARSEFRKAEYEKQTALEKKIVRCESIQEKNSLKDMYCQFEDHFNFEPVKKPIFHEVEKRDLIKVDKKQAIIEIIDKQPILTTENAGCIDKMLAARIQTKLLKYQDFSGPIWGIGGLSKKEIKQRFIEERKEVLKEDQEGKTWGKQPFNPVRKEYSELLRAVWKRKNELIKGYVLLHHLKNFYQAFNDAWPNTHKQLQVQFDFPGPSSHSSFPQLIYSMFPENDNEKQVVRDVCEKIIQQLDEEYEEKTLEIVNKLMQEGFFNCSLQHGEALLQYYKRNQKQLPNVLDPQDQFISCHIEDRKSENFAVEDILRYIEGFIAVANVPRLAHEYGLPSEQAGEILSGLVSSRCVDLAMSVCTLYRDVYCEPFVRALLMMQDKQQQVRPDLNNVLEQLRTEGAALTTSMRSALQHADFWDFGELLKEYQNEALVKAQDAIQLLHEQCQNLVRNADTVHVMDEEYQKQFVDELHTQLKKERAGNISPLRFRAFQYGFQTKIRQAQSPKVQSVRARMSPINPYQSIETMPVKKAHHVGFEAPIALLAARVAGVKVCEERYPFVVNSHVGRVQEAKFLQWVVEVGGVDLKVGML